jgi:polysaccharide export outer membrane protein
MKRSATLLLFMLAGLLMLSYVQTTNAQQPNPDNASTKSPDEPHRILRGEVLNIRVAGKPEFSREAVRVDERGMITMALILDDIKASCHTAEELASDIAALYLKVIQQRYQIEISVQEQNKLSIVVLGKVRAPGRFVLQRPVRLLEMLALAGGTSEGAGQDILITHTALPSDCNQSVSEIQPASTNQSTSHDVHEMDARVDVYNLADILRGDEKSNPNVQQGDIVTVMESQVVFVVGNVVKPQKITFKEPITITQAIAMSGGILKDSRTDKVRVIRQKLGELTKTVIIVDIKAVINHHAQDLILQSNDIVEVPSKKKRRGDHFGVAPSAANNLPLRVIP